MPVTERDIEAWAARIRPHFPATQQDIAEIAARVIAAEVGPNVKALRPDTSMATVMSWLKETQRGVFSPDWVEILMAVELESKSEVTDAFAEALETRTFGEYIEHLTKMRPNKSFERTRGR